MRLVVVLVGTAEAVLLGLRAGIFIVEFTDTYVSIILISQFFEQFLTSFILSLLLSSFVLFFSV